MGLVSCSSTTFAEAPGKDSHTSAMGTTICGSSSRGVSRTANSPSRRLAILIRGVSLLPMKSAARRPLAPRRWFVIPQPSWGLRRQRHRRHILHKSAVLPLASVDDDSLTGITSGQNLNALLQGAADLDPSKTGHMVIANHEQAGQFAPL